MKRYLMETGTTNRTRPKWFGSSCSSFGDSVFITVAMIALIFGMIPTPTSADIVSTYSGVLSSGSPKFIRPSSDRNGYFYQAVLVVARIGGYYSFTSNSSFDAYGYLYNGTFDPLSPSQNLIASDDDSGGSSGQFRINYGLQLGQACILVFTTYSANVAGNFSIRAAGPGSVSLTLFASTTTFISGILSSGSPTFSRPNGNTGSQYNYQAVEVIVHIFGAYNFTSSGSFDSYGCLYDASFNPLRPLQNLMAFGDDSGGSKQFQINHNLQSGHTYILVVTTFNIGTTGRFSLQVRGPASVYLSLITPTTSPAPTTSSTPTIWPPTTTTWPPPTTTTWPPTTTTTWPPTTTARVTTSLTPTSTFSGALLSSNPKFSRPDGNKGGEYNYQAIQVTVFRTGTYNLISNSSFDTYGCLYDGSFDPYYPTLNLITTDDDGAGNGQFRISRYLWSERTYILIFTTFTIGVTGRFTIRADGLASVYMTPFTPIATTTPYGITSTYSSNLYINSATFARPYGTSRNYYYQAIQATTYTSATYRFSSSSSIDTYGYLYEYSFDPSYPSRNLIESDDDGAGDRQFLINRYLQSGRKYILVVTTYSASTTGSFSVSVIGPSSVSLVRTTPSTSSPLSTLQIVAITFGCLMLCFGIFSICRGARQRRAALNQRAILLRGNRRVQPQILPMDNVHRNVTHVPYTISMPPKSVAVQEELPPSYEAYMSCLPNQERTDRF